MVNLVAIDRNEVEVVDRFPHPIREISHLWIPLRDGTRLAARMWLPQDADRNPVPAIVEYIPYRQADFTAPRDRLIHPYFAGNGYAALRVDIRGSGNSEGLPMDEYVEQEQEDALDVLDWISHQPWCSGPTGLIGISWGGFAALQVAARRPPSLKAIITVCSTDDRYNDDVHYMGGCLLSNNLGWGGVMHAYAMRPPDPRVVGERWRDMWITRMREAPNAIATWLQHPTYDAYWKHGSVCEDYKAIDCAVYALGGWTDGYTNSIPRLVRNLSCPVRAVIGPWAHGYPHIATPGPAVGFLQDAVRWWDRWLKDLPNGIDREPPLITYVTDTTSPEPYKKTLTGRWVCDSSWPSVHEKIHDYYLDDGRLCESLVQGSTVLQITSDLTTGLSAGEWCPHGLGPELPVDQHDDDNKSLTFDSPPLTTSMDIFGSPVLELRFSSTTSQANLAVRLCAISPAGAVSRVTYGVLNLSHRDGHENPTPLVANETYTATVTLNAVAQRIPAGFRLRVSLSTAYWPLIWPSRQKATLTMETSACHFKVPTRVCLKEERSPDFEKACVPVSEPVTWVRPVERKRDVQFDETTNTTTLTWYKDDGAYRLRDNQLEVDAIGKETHSIVGDQPLSARSTSEWTFEHRRDDWKVRIEVRNTITSDMNDFILSSSVEASENDEIVFENTEERTIPRADL